MKERRCAFVKWRKCGLFKSRDKEVCPAAMWDALPMHVIALVAEIVSDKADLGAIRLVSRHWCHAIDGFITSLHLTSETVPNRRDMTRVLTSISAKFSMVRKIEIGAEVLAADDLAHLTSFRHLTDLQLGETRDYPRSMGLEKLLPLSNLVALTLMVGCMHPDHMEHLTGLTTVTRLAVMRTASQEPATIEMRCSLPFLKRLGIKLTWPAPPRYFCTPFHGATYVPRMSRLARLSLSGLQIGSFGLNHLSCTPALTALGLAYTQLSNDALANLALMTQLRKLDLEGTTMGTSGEYYLSRLTWLRQLGLRRTDIDDDVVVTLTVLTSLKVLDLCGAHVGDRSLEVLERMRSLRFVDLPEGCMGAERWMHRWAPIPRRRA
eukprot:evm.model.scf_784EXC.2 EVM.evm.TU.scf_784EXC.2   scf_784EXC:31985-33438(+)